MLDDGRENWRIAEQLWNGHSKHHTE
jgi:hypothetical protein